jgi:hypothetical protein
MSNTTNVTTATVGAAIGAVLCWVLALFGIDVPAEVNLAVVTLTTAALTYFVPAKQKEKGRYAA